MAGELGSLAQAGQRCETSATYLLLLFPMDLHLPLPTYATAVGEVVVAEGPCLTVASDAKYFQLLLKLHRLLA